MKRRGVSIGVAVLAIAAVVWWRYADGGVARLGSTPPAVAKVARPSPAANVPRAPGPGAIAPEGSAAEDAEPVPAEVFAHATAEDYRRRARYPSWSAPLDDGADPILRDRQVTPVRGRGPHGDEPTLEVFPERSGFESPEPVVLHADLTAGGRRVRAREIRGTVLTEDGQVVGTVTYADDGSNGDLVAGDRLYTATLSVDPGRDAPLAQSYLVQVVARTKGRRERRAATSFLYSAPHAQLTGRFQDRIEDGSLVIDAEVDVAVPGRFHLEGTLYAPNDEHPVAWAQTASVLPVGRQWMQLGYYGLILRERGADGPYVLRWAALSTVTEMPNAKNRLVENAWTTQPYAAASFTDRPFGDADLLEAADRAERDAPALAGLEADR